MADEKVKTAEELMQEAEEMQKAFAPELYTEADGEKQSDDAGTSDKDDKGTSDDKSASDEDKSSAASDDKAEADAKEEGEKKADDATPPDYQAEVARLTAEVERLNKVIVDLNSLENSARGRLKLSAEDNSALKAEIASLKAKVAELEKVGHGSDKEAEELKRRMSEKYGDDFIEDFDAYLATKNKGKEQPVADAEPRTADVQPASTPTSKAGYIDALTFLVPDWQSIVNDKKFSEFLVHSGSMQKAVEADSNGDALTVASVYNAFKQHSLQSTPVVKTEDNQPATDKEKKSKDHLEAPDTTRRAKSDAPPKETYTPEQIKTMKDEITALKFSGDPAKVKRAEQLQAKLDGFLDSLSFSKR